MAEIDTDAAEAALHTTAEEEVRVCLFGISGDVYAVTVDMLAEVIIPQKIFPVPTTPSHVIGVISLRGNIVPLVDIRPALSLQQTAGAGQAAIMRIGSMTIGIVVDAVTEVVAVPRSSILPLPSDLSVQDAASKSRSRFLTALVQRPNGVAALLNIERILEAISIS